VQKLIYFNKFNLKGETNTHYMQSEILLFFIMLLIVLQLMKTTNS